MKKVFKRFYKSKGFRKAVCWLIANYIRLVHYTSRRNTVIDPGAVPYMRGELPALFAFWHGRLLMMPMACPPKRKMNVLISTHGDGELIAQVMYNFRFSTVRGSSTRDGANAAIGAVRALQSGENVSITPDGPLGPALKVQAGTLSIAEIAKVPVISSTYSASRHKRMRSWDGFMLALPFGKICYTISAPLFNPTKEAVEKRMIEDMEYADAQVR